MKYSDIINISHNFRDVYNLDDESKDEWKRYIVTKEFVSTLEDVVSAFTSSKKKSFWIQGTYGTGKSHTLAVFKHLLCDGLDDIEDFLKRINNSQLKNSFVDFRKNSRMFPVVLSGIHGINDSLSLSQFIQNQVKKAIIESGEDIVLNLLTDMEQVKKIVENDAYDAFIEKLIAGELAPYCDNKDEVIERLNENDFTVFKIIEKKLKYDGLNLTTTSDINKWLLEVNGKIKETGKYNGIVIFWDEFTSILEISERKALFVDVQQIATLAAQDIYLFIVTHKLYNAIEGYKDLIKEDQKKIEDRFFIEKYEIDTATNYNIMSNALERLNETEVKRLIDERVLKSIAVRDAIDKIVGRKSNTEEIKNQIVNLYPFHPYVAFCSTNLARIVGSAKRSVFQFLNDDKHGFLDFIKNDIDSFKFLTIERMWDFFFNKFQDEPKYLIIINTFLKNESFIDTLCSENDKQMYIDVLKCTLLLNILQESISSTDEFSERALSSPTLDNISLAYVGVYEKDDIEKVLNIYNDQGIVTKNPRGEYTVVVSSIAPEKVKAESKALMSTFRDVSAIMQDYGNLLLSFKQGLSSAFLRSSTVNILPFAIPDGGLGSYIESNFTNNKKIQNNIKIIVFLKRGFDDPENGFIDEISEEELRGKIIEYASNKQSDVIFMIVKDMEFGKRRYTSWIEAKARSKILNQSENHSEARDFIQTADQWINEYLSNLKNARYSVIFRDSAVEKTYNDASKFIQNDIVKAIIYRYGLENLKLSTTVWKPLSKPKQASIQKMLQQTLSQVKGTSRSTALNSALLPLLQNVNGLGDIFNEEMKIISTDENHPIIKMMSEVDKILDESKSLTDIDLGEKLEILFKPPYGFYNCECYNAALGLCLRKYVNKIRLLSAAATIVNETTMSNIVTAIFDQLIDDKSSNVLRVRFSTESEIKLMNNLSTVFGVSKTEDSSLTSVKWEVRDKFDKNYKAPLWVLKSYTKKEKLKNLIDKLFKFTVTIDDDFTEEETKELSLLFENNIIDFSNLLQEIKNDNCFIDYLKINPKNTGKTDDFIVEEYDYLKDKMKSENNFKTEKDVNEFIDDFIQYKNNQDNQDVATDNGEVVVAQLGGGVIVPGVDYEKKINDLKELCVNKNFNDATVDFIMDFASNNKDIIDRIMKYISNK